MLTGLFPIDVKVFCQISRCRRCYSALAAVEYSMKTIIILVRLWVWLQDALFVKLVPPSRGVVHSALHAPLNHPEIRFK